MPEFKLIHVFEPERGIQILLWLNEKYNSIELFHILVPIFADVFLFVYPIVLVGMYLYGYFRETLVQKIGALSIFFSALLGIIVNQIIQSIFWKTRPELAIDTSSKLIMQHLPTNPFPSDHATVSFAFAMAISLYLLHSNVRFKILYIVLFWVIAIITSVSRVMGGIHRPTDILLGSIIGILSALFIHHFRLPLQKKVYLPLVKLQEEVFGWFLGREL